MFPLLLGSVLSLAIMIERSFVFIRSGIKRDLLDELKEEIVKNNFPSALKKVEKARCPIARIIKRALLFRDRSIQLIETEISLEGNLILKALERNLHLLEIIGRFAPMVGLLGTVMGMVDAFQKVALEKGMVDPSILASGIWAALITTVAGLLVGIPTLIAYHLFERRMENTAFWMKQVGEEMVSLLKR
jgi:biopolymer transport protein ExbB